MMFRNDRIILLTGGTGYVGGRLLTALESAGESVRCMSRNPGHLHPKSPLTASVYGDVLDLPSLEQALEGIDTAFFLVHSMKEGASFEELELRGAENFARAARSRNVKRIVYLGGLGDDDTDLSAHLRSRHRVGAVLATFGGVCIELRTSIVIGSGSISFEMIRALVERLPMMIIPRWVRVLTQPISIDDLLKALVVAIDLPVTESKVFEIGGRDVVSYGGIMQEYARQRKLRRLMIPVPFLTPRLSSLWLGLVTPVYSRIGRTLVNSLRHATVVRENALLTVFKLSPKGLEDSIAAALRNEDSEVSETRWCDSVSSSPQGLNGTRLQSATRIVDSRNILVRATLEKAFAPIQAIGGASGWYWGNLLWRIRGTIDLLLGGVGFRRGRRHPLEVRVGDVIDFWRVEAFEPTRLLRLRAEMKVPGRAWLQFETEDEGGATRVTQTALFDPSGIAGLAYWYLLYPLHALIFSAMLKGIKSRGEAKGRASDPLASL